MTCWTIMHHNPNFEAIIFLAIRNHPILSLIGCVSIYDLVCGEGNYRVSKFTWWLVAHVCHLSFQGQDSSMRNKDKYYPKEGTSLKSIDHAPSTISRSCCWWWWTSVRQKFRIWHLENDSKGDDKRVRSWPHGMLCPCVLCVGHTQSLSIKEIQGC
jgi:hypothetical protein